MKKRLLSLILILTLLASLSTHISFAASEINGLPNDFVHTVDCENKVIYVSSATLSPEKLCNELGIKFNKAGIYKDSALSEPASYYIEDGNILDLNGNGEDLYEIKVKKEHFTYENFESSLLGSDAKIGTMFAWSSMDENGSVKVDGNESNKYAHFKGTYVEGSGTNILFQSDEENGINVPSVISFDLKMNSFSKSRFELHLISSKNNQRLCVFAIAGSRMSCFEDYQQRVSLTDYPIAKGEKQRFAVRIDPKAGTFSLYIDGEHIRTVDYDTITTYKKRTTPTTGDFCMDLSAFRIRIDSNVATLNESFDAELDNFAIYPDRSIEEGISLCRPLLSDSGRRVSAYAESLGGNEGEYDCYLSLYDNDELIAIDTQNLSFDTASGVPLELTLPERADGNQYRAKLFVWNGENSPICRAVTFIGSEPDLPYAYELSAMLDAERTHPYIWCSESDLERIKKLKETDVNVEKWCADVIAKADRICTYSIDTKKWYNTPEEFYHIYYVIPDGVRLLDMTSKASGFITALCVAYRLTGNEKYADRATEILMRVCGEGELGFPDWNPSHFLDVSAMCEGVAAGYDLLQDYLDDEEKAIVINALKTNALDPGISAYAKNSFWTHDTSNWNPAVNYGLLQALFCVYGTDESYNAELEALFEDILHSLPLSIDTFYPDGAWYEGPRYAPVHNIAKVIDTLERAFGTDFGFFNRSGFSNVASYYTYVDGPAGVHNYSDCVEYSLSGAVLYWLAQKLDNISLYNKQLSRQELGNVDILLWYRPMTGSETDMPKDAYFRNVELFTMRQSSSDANGLWLSACGGRTKHSHSHYDCGNFVLDYAGYRWASDLGSDTTNTTHYSTSYYFLEAYRSRAEGHNVPVINPDSDPGQIDGFAKVEKSNLNANEPYAVINLSPVYDPADATIVRRGYKLLNGRTVALIRDEYTLSDESEVYWFMHTQATPTIDGNTVILENPDGVKMKLEFKAENCNSEVYITDAAPMTDKGSPNPEWQGKNPEFKKVAIKLTGNGNINLSVLISPYETVTDITGVNSVEKW